LLKIRDPPNRIGSGRRLACTNLGVVRSGLRLALLRCAARNLFLPRFLLCGNEGQCPVYHLSGLAPATVNVIDAFPRLPQEDSGVLACSPVRIEVRPVTTLILRTTTKTS